MERITITNKIINKKNWIEWLIGFSDAEANFQVFPKKRINLTKNIEYYNIGYGFHLSLSIRDYELLQNIKLNLNSLGKIYKYDNSRQEARLAITKLKDLNWLITNIFEISPLLTKHQRERYSRFKYGVLNKFNRVENIQEYRNFITNSYITNLSNFNFVNEIAFDNWISGFINGEGSFIINSKGNLIFYIEQAESEVLNLIKKRLDLGPNVFFRIKRNENYKNTYSLGISSKKDIKSLIKFFENPDLMPLCGNKKEQYSKWKDYYNFSGKYS